jgi:hypothetical protein
MVSPAGYKIILPKKTAFGAAELDEEASNEALLLL